MDGIDIDGSDCAQKAYDFAYDIQTLTALDSLYCPLQGISVALIPMYYRLLIHHVYKDKKRQIEKRISQFA